MDKKKGCMIGCALGDAIGLINEFRTKENKLNVIFPYKDAIREWQPNDWTDDTDHMILILDLANQNNLSEISFANSLKNWCKNGFSELGDDMGHGLGGTIASVVRHPNFILDPKAVAYEIWEKSGKYLASNGSLMRTAILSFYPNYLELSQNICLTTHADPKCVASCLIVNEAIYLISVGEIKNLTNRAFAVGINYLSQTHIEQHFTGKRGIPKIWQLNKHPIDELIEYRKNAHNIKSLKLDEQGMIGYVFKCLGCAMWAMLCVEYYEIQNKPLPYFQLIRIIVDECGDSDTNSAVAGSIFGTYLGYAKLNEQVGEKINAMPHVDWLLKKL